MSEDWRLQRRLQSAKLEKVERKAEKGLGSGLEESKTDMVSGRLELWKERQASMFI